MECDKCKNSFNSTNKQPYSLYPCSHTYCLRCVEDLEDNKCPECKSKIKAVNKNLILKFKIGPHQCDDKLYQATSAYQKLQLGK